MYTSVFCILLLRKMYCSHLVGWWDCQKNLWERKKVWKSVSKHAHGFSILPRWISLGCLWHDWSLALYSLSLPSSFAEVVWWLFRGKRFPDVFAITEMERIISPGDVTNPQKTDWCSHVWFIVVKRPSQIRFALTDKWLVLVGTECH